jgi:CrcB protein
MSRSDRHDELPLDPDAAILGTTSPLHFQPSLVAVVALGALPGTLARYVVSRVWPAGATAFPLSTLVINLFGAFLLGVILEALARRGDDSGRRREVRLFVGTGFCGAFTTYSTLAVQAQLLVRNNHTAIGLGYALVTVIGGLLATMAGITIAAEDHTRRQHRLPIDPDLAEQES